MILPPFGIPAADLSAPRAAINGAAAPYYLRVMLKDRPGTLALVANALGRAEISIDRMRQGQHAAGLAPVLIVTHACGRAALDSALAEIADLDVATDAPVAYRIEPV
jgi:homoserine dehydrogenase